MVLQPRLSVTQTQSLALTPALRASIQLLQLSVQDLDAFVARKAEENPLLEVLEGPASSERTQRASAGVDLLAERVAAAPSLSAHLLEQAALIFSGRREARIAARFIEELDEAGYLGITTAEVAADSGTDEATCRSVLARLQGLEPSGLFARDLRECLALQLAARGRLDGFFQALLAALDCLPTLGVGGLAAKLDLPVDAVEQGLAELRRLDPKPGLSFGVSPVVPLIPDLLVYRGPRGDWQVAVNPETVPRIRLDRDTQRSLLPRLRSKDERSYLSEQAQEVAWLRRALARRFETLLAVGRAILDRQGHYFSQGPAALKPLTRRNLAEVLDLSEATISRVVANKYLNSPRGTEPLKRFFSQALGEAGEVSAAAARERLRELVEAESRSRPLSDAALAESLSASGLPVARRTVAKYRDLLRIPSASDRRRLNQLR